LPLVFLAVVAGLFVLVEVLTIGMVVSMGRSILRALSALRQGTARLRSGNFRYRIPVEADDELWNVAHSFNDMAGDLDKARDLEIEKERIEGELELARQIQERLLPARLPAIPRCELAGRSLPARHVGGDYFDALHLGGDRVALVIADVSGKGVPAALLMSSFRASLLSTDIDREGPALTLARVNAFLHNSVEPGRFVTAFLAVLHTATGRLVYSNAGHNPPLLLRRGAEDPHLLRQGGLVLGLFGTTVYQQAETVVLPGDLLAMYTDGVSEAMDEDERFYGEERFLDLLRRNRNEPCHEILREVLEEVRTFSGGAGQTDDVTVLMARRR
jgi:sigma-B regulation protein RsbU (phosphoserine phosphatase)